MCSAANKAGFIESENEILTKPKWESPKLGMMVLLRVCWLIDSLKH